MSVSDFQTARSIFLKSKLYWRKFFTEKQEHWKVRKPYLHTKTHLYVFNKSFSLAQSYIFLSILPSDSLIQVFCWRHQRKYLRLQNREEPVAKMDLTAQQLEQ